MSKTLLRDTLIKKYFWHFCWHLIFIHFHYENPSFIIFSAFDKILVSEYKLFKRSNKANLLIGKLYKSLQHITAKVLLGIQVITHNNQGGKLYKSLPYITAKVLLGMQVITHNNQDGKLYKRLPHVTAKVLLGIQVITPIPITLPNYHIIAANKIAICM
jgi:hypothetical protein